MVPLEDKIIQGEKCIKKSFEMVEQGVPSARSSEEKELRYDLLSHHVGSASCSIFILFGAWMVLDGEMSGLRA